MLHEPRSSDPIGAPTHWPQADQKALCSLVAAAPLAPDHPRRPLTQPGGTACHRRAGEGIYLRGRTVPTPTGGGARSNACAPDGTPGSESCDPRPLPAPGSAVPSARPTVPTPTRRHPTPANWRWRTAASQLATPGVASAFPGCRRGGGTKPGVIQDSPNSQLIGTFRLRARARAS